MSNTRLLKNTILYSIGEILPRAIAFILLPIYTQYLSPSDYGISSYTHTIIIFLYVLGAFALNSYVLRYYFIHTDENERRVLIGTAHLTIIGLNAIILALAFLLMPYIIEHNHIQVPWNPYFRLAFIINFLDCMSIIPMVVYRVRQEALKFVTLGISRTILTVLLTLYFVVYLKKGLIGTFQAQLYVLIPYSVVYFWVIQNYGRWRINWSYVKEGLLFCAPLIPGAICYQMLSVSDRVILERNVGLDQLGIYNVACQMALALNIVIQSGYRAIEPELFRRYGKEGFFEFIKKTQSIFFSAIYIGAFALCLFSQEIFHIMTSEAFHKGYWLVPALMVGVIMTGQNVIYSGILQGEKRTKVIGLATLIGAIASVLTNVIFVPLYGVYAASFASALSLLIMNSILFYAMTYPGKSMHKELGLVLLVPLVCYLLFSILGDISVVGAIIKLFILMFYFVITIYVMKVDFQHLKDNFLKKSK